MSHVPIEEIKAEAERRLSSDYWNIFNRSVNPAKLVHELEVHRIELELQRQSLMEALGQSEALSERYKALFELAPGGCFTLSELGEIEEVNLRATEMLCTTREQLYGRRLAAYFTDDSVVDWNTFFATVLGGRGEVSAFGLRMRRSRSNLMPLYVDVVGRSTQASPNHPLCLRIAIKDISGLRIVQDDSARVLLSRQELH